MNHEIQLSRGPNGHGGLPAGVLPPTDFWTQGQAPASPAMPPLKKMHRLLRGRYPLTITLALIGAITLSIAGWCGMGPRYDAPGMVEIAPTVASAHPVDPQVPMWAMLIEQHVTLLTSAPVIAAAVEKEPFKSKWEAHHAGMPPTVDDVMANVDAQHVKVTPYIKIDFTDRDPEVASAGTHAILEAYMEQYGDSDAKQRENKIAFAQQQKSAMEGSRTGLEDELQNLSQKYGTTDLTALLASNQLSLKDSKVYLDAAQEKLETAKANLANKVKVDPADKEKLQEQLIQLIASRDEEMRKRVDLRNEASMNFMEITRQEGYLPNSQPYQRARNNYEFNQQQVIDYLNLCLMHTTDPDVQRLVPGLFNGDIPQLQKEVAMRQKEYDSLMAQAKELYSQEEKIQQVKDKIAQIDGSEREVDHRIEDLRVPQTFERDYGDAQVKVRNWGTTSTIANDRRKVLAGAGFLFGGLLPVGLLLLVGSFDRRFRYSDDAEGTPLSDANLLGILPNLPDRLSDPHQAGVAAHCVHQIRTMLQIGRSSDEPQVFCITSASPGDGKTSLTLALGLSYAACGARTLLIDCDLIGAGLSSRLNIEATEGVLEAVANRVLLQYIRTTDVADVAVLPVGASQSHHASTLSPVGLRRLILEAKKHFDVVLIDTGPVMGSIEASLVAAAADRTILAVARGQQRPLVEKALAHLRAIGAHMAGVVFNKAQARDFERSFSGMSLRSQRNGRSHAGAYGPVARAVAGTSFKHPGADE